MKLWISSFFTASVVMIFLRASCPQRSMHKLSPSAWPRLLDLKLPFLSSRDPEKGCGNHCAKSLGTSQEQALGGALALQPSGAAGIRHIEPAHFTGEETGL